RPGAPCLRWQFVGGRDERDSMYHQGPAWAWLIGPFVSAHLRVYGDKAAARRYLLPLMQHLDDAGLGSISELFDGQPPYTPRGAIAQAWSVAEVVRTWYETLE
ncbi:glycogen debranching protein, partial [Candidatus Gracilibacteria bacterium]|nr:glycogen debranching protein [Candidatus Gracilibacteria bacterium]